MALAPTFVVLLFVLSVFLFFQLASTFPSVPSFSTPPIEPFRSTQISNNQAKLPEEPVTIVGNDCPPIERLDGEVGFIIRSQADADKFKNCHTIKGLLYVAAIDATSPIIVDGPIGIIGELKIEPDNTGPALDSISMNTLVYVDGDVRLRQYGQKPIFLTALDFPSLRFVTHDFEIQYFDNLITLNLPILEYVGWFSLMSLPALQNFNIPNLHFVGNLHLSGLSSLKTLSFPAGLKGAVGFVSIVQNGFSSIEGLEWDQNMSLAFGQTRTLQAYIFPP